MLQVRLSKRVAGLLLLAGPLLGTTPAMAHGAKPRIAVLAVTAEQLGADVRSKLDAALAGGLAASGVDVIDSGTTGKRIDDKGLAGCQTATCRVAIAEATGARYLMRGSVESTGRNYTVRLEMIDGISGGVIGMREDRCEICTESDVYDTAGLSASALKSEVLKGDPWKRGGGKTEATTQGDTAAGNSGAKLDPPANDQGQGKDRLGTEPSLVISPGTGGSSEEARTQPRWRALSFVGIGAGLVAVGAGVYLLSINGDGTCNAGPGALCEFRYRTGAGGFTLIGAGALAAAIGTTLLIGRF